MSESNNEMRAYGFLWGAIELYGDSPGEAAELAIEQGYDEEKVEKLLEDHFK